MTNKEFEKLFLDLNSVLVKFWVEQGRPDKEIKIELPERMLHWYKKMGYVTLDKQEPEIDLEEEIDKTVYECTDGYNFDWDKFALHFYNLGKTQSDMKAEGLMVGDLLTFKDCVGDSVFPILKVNGILPDTLFVRIDYSDADDEVDYEDIIGIPLTPEILEKNGFTYCKSDGGFYLPTTISYGNWDVDVILFNVTDEYRNNQLHIGTPDDSITLLHLMECNHVHELQHALRLCGIEKEIVI